MERGGEVSGPFSTCTPEVETSLDSLHLPHLSRQATIEAVSIEIEVAREVGAVQVGMQLHTVTMETSGDHPDSHAEVSMLHSAALSYGILCSLCMCI